MHSLHEKRSNKDEKTSVVAANFFHNAAPITKSQRIKALVKLILKKLIKKFSYEIIFDGVFAYENSVKSLGVAEAAMETGNFKNKVCLTGGIRQGLENLLSNLKKLIDKEKQKKQEDQANSKKEAHKSNNLDLMSIYTTNSHKAANAALGGNE